MDNPSASVDSSDLVARVKEEKRKFEAKYGSWREEARENYDMVAGDGRQWDPIAKAQMEQDEKVAVEFDRLGTIVDAVSGSEINNRQEATYIPRLPGNVQRQGVGATRTAAARWVRDNCDAEDEESDAFVDVLITGVGCTQTRMDYEEDEEGQILIERKDPLRMGWDASATKRNNADAKCVWEECKFTKEEIESRWPDKADEIQQSSDLEGEDDELRIVNQETAYDATKPSKETKGLIDVTHYQWYEVDQIYKVASPTGQVVEMQEERFMVAQQMAEGMGMPLRYARIPRRRYMQAFICGNVELEVSKAPCQHGFSFQFITGKRDRNRGYWYGLVRPGKDPQRWANKFFSQILHIINTNAKGGVMAETGAVSNVRKFEEDWAKSDAVNWLNPGGLQKIQPKQPAQIPNSLFQTMEFAISSIRDCTGVNLELLGLVDRQQAGVLEAQRTQAGLTILAPFFGSLRHYRKRQGRLLAYFIQEYISDGRLIRVAGEENEQFIPLLREPIDIDYDVVVDSAPTARDTKEKTWAAIMPVLQMFGSMQIPPPPEVLDYLPVPASLAQIMKRAYMQKMQQMQQPNPVQERMQMAEIWDKEAGAEQKEAGAAKSYMDAGMAGIQALQMLWGPQQPMQQPMQQPQPGAMPAPPMVQ